MKTMMTMKREVEKVHTGETFTLSELASKEFWNSENNAYKMIRERWISEFKAMVLTGKLMGVMYLKRNENGENVYLKFA